MLILSGIFAQQDIIILMSGDKEKVNKGQPRGSRESEEKCQCSRPIDSPLPACTGDKVRYHEIKKEKKKV